MAFTASAARPALGSDNARHVPKAYLVRHFVPTDPFWSLIRATNQIILGSRGSGKTSYARMLSHSHLSQLHDDRARLVIKNKSFVGVYVPTKVEWVGGFYNMKRKHQNEAYFRWRLNVSICSAFLETARSCLDCYIEQPDRLEVETLVCRELSKIWLGADYKIFTLRELEAALERLDLEQSAAFLASGYKKATLFERSPVFATPLLRPLVSGIKLTGSLLGLNDDTVWAVCFDEAESLWIDQQRVINTLMRAHSGAKVAIKIATTPYGHLTLETTGAAPLNQGHDFEYVYIDIGPAAQSPANQDARRVQRRILQRLFEESSDYKNVSFKELLGPSPLIDSEEGEDDDKEFLDRLTPFASSDLLVRARRLRNDPKHFSNEIVRKLRGTVFLREAVAGARGNTNLEVYCGANLVLRCSDANPRKLIQIVNRMLTEGSWSANKVDGIWHTNQIRPAQQTRIMKALSQTELLRPRSEPGIGEDLYGLVNLIGRSLEYSLHKEPLTSDQYLSIEIGPDVRAHEWLAVTKLVDLGILYPNIRLRDPNPVPVREGTFRFSFFLCPHFNLLPRRGRPRSLREILRRAPVPEAIPGHDPRQLDLLR